MNSFDQAEQKANFINSVKNAQVAANPDNLDAQINALQSNALAMQAAQNAWALLKCVPYENEAYPTGAVSYASQNSRFGVLFIPIDKENAWNTADNATKMQVVTIVRGITLEQDYITEFYTQTAGIL